MHVVSGLLLSSKAIAPAWWDAHIARYYLGDYSDAKYAEFIEATGISDMTNFGSYRIKVLRFEVEIPLAGIEKGRNSGHGWRRGNECSYCWIIKMNVMKIHKYIWCAVVMFFLYGCFDDKGNYDYTGIPEVKVLGYITNEEELGSFWALTVGDVVELEPILEYTGDPRLSL